MLYILLIVFVALPLIYTVGVLHCSIRTYRNLENGSKVYCRRMNALFPDETNYYESSIIVDGNGNKYIDRFSIRPLTTWDVINGNVLTEDEYNNVFD